MSPDRFCVSLVTSVVVVAEEGDEEEGGRVFKVGYDFPFKDLAVSALCNIKNSML
jgi:hypothetical protein